MTKPGEHKTVHPPSLKLRRTGARILAYAGEAGWTFVSRVEAEERRAGFPTRRGWGHSGMLGLSEERGGQECPPSVGAEKIDDYRARQTRQSEEFADRNVRAPL